MDIYILSIVTSDAENDVCIEHEAFEGAQAAIQKIEELAHESNGGIISDHWLADIDGWDPTEGLKLVLADDDDKVEFQLSKVKLTPLLVNNTKS